MGTPIDLTIDDYDDITIFYYTIRCCQDLRHSTLHKDVVNNIVALQMFLLVLLMIWNCSNKIDDFRYQAFNYARLVSFDFVLIYVVAAGQNPHLSEIDRRILL